MTSGPTSSPLSVLTDRFGTERDVRRVILRGDHHLPPPSEGDVDG